MDPPVTPPGLARSRVAVIVLGIGLIGASV
jgi:hypothetical protein